MNSFPLHDEVSFLRALKIPSATDLTLDDEMKGIFVRADELAMELDAEYRASAECAVVTERAKNLFHEFLVKIRSSFEFAMNRIYDKYTTLQGVMKAKRERQAGFPICETECEFRKKLNSLGLSHLETDKPALHAKLRQTQPFMVKNNKTMPILRDLSNLGKHARLAKQMVKLQPAKKFTGPGGQVAIASEGVTYNEGKSDGPWPNCQVEDITWATIDAYGNDGEAIFPIQCTYVWNCV